MNYRRYKTTVRGDGRFKILAVAIALSALPGPAWSQFSSEDSDGAAVERGRYIARIAGCNDCHTPGYLMSEGNVAEEQWLIGDTLGWRGPWGTTYASNLRLFVAAMSEDQWVDAARSLKRRPPMPWFNLNLMEDDDLRALYQFIRSLGDPGKPAPAYLPPDVEPPGPYATFPAPPQ